MIHRSANPARQGNFLETQFVASRMRGTCCLLHTSIASSTAPLNMPKPGEGARFGDGFPNHDLRGKRDGVIPRACWSKGGMALTFLHPAYQSGQGSAQRAVSTFGPESHLRAVGARIDAPRVGGRVPLDTWKFGNEWRQIPRSIQSEQSRLRLGTVESANLASVTHCEFQF